MDIPGDFVEDCDEGIDRYESDTALDQPSDRVRGLEVGADDFLTKPVDDVQLMARVKSLVRLKSLTDELRARALTGQEIAMEEAMRAMAHPLRLKILCLVGNQELSVLEIVEAVGTTQSNVSQHLGILRDHGLLESRKEANKVYYRIGDPRVLKMISLTREIFCSF